MPPASITLGDECELITKGTTPSTLGLKHQDHGVPFIRAQNLVDGTVSVEVDPLFIDRATHDLLRRSKIKPSDVLLSIAGTVGRAAIVPANAEEMNCNQAVAIIRPSSRIDRRFLLHWLSSRDAVAQVTKGKVTGTISNLSLGQISNLKILLPPLDEQRRIAAILEKIDALRRQRKCALGLFDKLVHAIFRETFVEKIPDRWPDKSLDSLALDIRTGPFGSQLLHSEFVSEGVAVLGIDNVVANEFRWSERRYITPEKYAQLRRYTVSPKDVLITIMGTCGRCAVVPDDVPVAINTKHLCCITLNRSICLPEFLQAAFLQHPDVLEQLGARAKGAVMPGLNMGIIKSLSVPLPPIEIQEKFAQDISVVKRALVKAQTSETESNELFSSLQSRAFSGQL